MNLLLVFVLCGVTCCLAGPTCSRDELAKCSQGPPGPPGTEEEELDRVCKETKCWLKIYDRCGTAIFGPGPFPLKGYHRVVDAFCDRSNPLRKKYLDNVGCIRSMTGQEALKRLLNTCGIHDAPKEEFCREIPKGFSCAVDYITGKCGNDAGDVFKIGALPGLDPYDCLSS